MIKESRASAIQTSSRRRTATGRKSTATRKRTPQRKGKCRKRKKQRRGMSTWLFRTLVWVASAAILVGFFYLFINPYSYRWKPCYGMKAYGVCLPYGFQVHGFDVSHHQGEIDWAALENVRKQQFPICFVFMKASEGKDFGDHRFADNFEAARRHGFIRGAYHFYNPKSDARRQAEFFIRSVRLKAGDLPPVLDVEQKGEDLKQFRADVKTWLHVIERHYKVKPILYTSYKFKEAYLNDSAFNEYPYWIAHYYVDTVSYKGQWRFWQHTDRGILPGIKEKVDLNVFNGSLEQLKAMTIPAGKIR